MRQVPIIAALALAALPAAAAPGSPQGLAPVSSAIGRSSSAADAGPVPPEIPVALLVDISTGQTLLAREAQRRFVPASVTKVMTVYTAFKLMDEGKVSPMMRFQVSEELEEMWSGEGSSMFLKAGEQPTFAQLLLGATTVSGNDACVAIAVAATGSLDKWLALMNRNAADLGMRDTHFGSPNGFPDGGRTFTNASDLALLAHALVARYPQYYSRYFGHQTMTWRDITQRNHDPITGYVEGADGLKTGFTNEAGYTFLGSGERDGRRLVMVLAGAPTARMRDQAARELLKWGFAGFRTRRLLLGDTIVGEALVQDGSDDRVALRTAGPVNVALPKGSSPKVEMSIRYRGPVKAPIAEGDPVARLHIEIEGQEPVDVPLKAAAAVDEANVFERTGNGLAALFD